MPKSYFYGVRCGRAGPFVYSSWEDCQRATKGVAKARYKKFLTYADADRWIRSPSPESNAHRVAHETTFPISRDALGDRSSWPSKTSTRLVPASSLVPRSLDHTTPVNHSGDPSHPDTISLLDSSSDIDELPRQNTKIIELSSDSEDGDDSPAYTSRPLGRSSPEASIAGRQLSVEQQHIFNMVIREHMSVFFTGSAGTGKSYLLRSIIGALRPHGQGTGVTAPTGIAAVNIGGCTLHSWAGIGLGKGKAEDLLKKLGGFARQRWLQTETLIVDEISMCDGSLLDKLDYIGRRVRGNLDQPFGGLQLVFCGDFFQLPPVPGELHNVKVPIMFAFEARCWKEAVPHSFTLTRVFRQQEQVLIDMLNEARVGRLSSSSITTFRKLARSLQFSDGIEPTRLFPKKDQVKRENDRRLESLTGSSYTFIARDFAGKDNRGYAISPVDATQKLDRNVVAPASITLKEGAQVMLVTNLEQGSLVNGSQGIVIGFNTPSEASNNGYDLAAGQDGGRLRRTVQSPTSPSPAPAQGDPAEVSSRRWPIVKFNTGQIVLVEPFRFSVVNVKGEPEAAREQIPLILAWALSVHKSQGQTLERVAVDLTETFEKGQAYVALSRATRLEGLQVLGFAPEKVMAHHRVIEWAQSLTVLRQNDRREQRMKPEGSMSIRCYC